MVVSLFRPSHDRRGAGLKTSTRKKKEAKVQNRTFGRTQPSKPSWSLRSLCNNISHFQNKTAANTRVTPTRTRPVTHSKQSQSTPRGASRRVALPSVSLLLFLLFGARVLPLCLTLSLTPAGLAGGGRRGWGLLRFAFFAVPRSLLMLPLSASGRGRRMAAA